MISRFLCGVVAVAMAGPCFGQTPMKASRAAGARPAELESFGVTVAENLQVTRVEPGSAADEMGLKEGDAIRDLNGLGFGNPEQFARALSAVPAQRVVRVVVSRHGSPVRLTGRVDQGAVGIAGVRTVSQTVVKQEYPAVSNNPPSIVKGMGCSGCGNCGSSCGSGCSSCGPYGYGPGTQWMTCGPVGLDLSNGIGLWDPCNAWGPHPCTTCW
ncbi:MAG TPA: PDZ domain-containing protein [Caulifigura sp.]|nr:PDZ domain-containing protein [Caulifigura sp.]